MAIFGERFKKDLAYHLLIWLLLIIPQGVGSVYLLNKSTSLYLWNTLIKDGLVLIIIYGNFFYLIPALYKKKKWVLYYAIVAVLAVLFLAVTYYWSNYVSSKMGREEDYNALELLFVFFDFARNMVISFLLYSLREKFDQEKQMDQVQLEKLTTEINYLRAQINPHFLFNTLNNLYGMALQKSDRTPETILRLSKMMDYMLYDSDEPKVYLVKDLENLDNYIALERIRQGNNAVIKYTVEGEVTNQKVVPLLFLPLIENGFKHGVNELMKEAYLDIHLRITATDATLTVKNNYKSKTDTTPAQRGGIGLVNLERRLELFYPGKHQLSVRQTDSSYDVQLNIRFA
jgi:two-component system, LytTR family, sensor kinase